MTTDTTTPASPDDGGPAFPQYVESPMRDGGIRKEINGGMSLRDWFAGRETLTDADGDWVETAMCEELAGRPMPDKQRPYLLWLEWEADWRAALKYMRADAMLRARKRGR